jgi:hypothetical protein
LEFSAASRRIFLILKKDIDILGCAASGETCGEIIIIILRIEKKATHLFALEEVYLTYLDLFPFYQ